MRVLREKIGGGEGKQRGGVRQEKEVDKKKETREGKERGDKRKMRRRKE